MAIVEDVKKLAERVTGFGRPAPADLAKLVRKRKPAAFNFSDDGLIPNHPRRPLLLYRTPVRLGGQLRFVHPLHTLTA